MLQIGTHKLIPKPNEIRYYICEVCGIIIYKGENTYIISVASDAILCDPTEVTCDEWIIKSVIE